MMNIPFSIDRASGKKLVDQVTDGLRRAIETGVYKPGDVLPTTRELAGELHVARAVALKALDRLKAESLINSRPKAGSVVLAKREMRWRGSVLVVVTDHAGSYFSNVFSDQVKTTLVEAGFICMTVVAESFHGPCPKVALLEAMLKQHFDLAIVLFSSPAVERSLAKSGTPFVVIGCKGSERRNCVGWFRIDWNAAVADFTQRCVESGVERVLQVSAGRTAETDASKALKAAGIRCEKLIVAERRSVLKPQTAQRDSYVRFARYLAEHRNDLPDVVLFTDDHRAVGGYAAICEAGLVVPADVQVVTWSNRGDEPFFPSSPTRIELDPRRNGADVAEAVLGYLTRGEALPALTLETVYITGATFG